MELLCKHVIEDEETGNYKCKLRNERGCLFIRPDDKSCAKKFNMTENSIDNVMIILIHPVQRHPAQSKKPIQFKCKGYTVHAGAFEIHNEITEDQEVEDRLNTIIPLSLIESIRIFK